MMRFLFATVLLLNGVAYAVDEKVDPTKNLVVKGKSVSKEELESSQPMATYAKDEVMSVVTTGKPACKNGTGGASFDGSAFKSGEETFNFDQLVARLAQLKNAKKVSCFHVQAHRYDKKIYTQLEHALVDQNQISLIWDEVK